MKIMPESMVRITQPLGDIQSFAQMGNMYGNVNRKLTICDNPNLTTPEQSLKFEMTRVNHLTPLLLERA
jgi:hypothetical protein